MSTTRSDTGDDTAETHAGYNEYADPPSEIELDLLRIYENSDDDDAEILAAQLKTRLSGIYTGEWNDEPSQRNISDDEIFSEFIEDSRRALNQDLLPSIKRRFTAYENQYEEFEEQRDKLLKEREELREQYRDYYDWDAYQESVDAVADDPQFDYEEYMRKEASRNIDEDRWINEVAEFRDELLGIRNQMSNLETEYVEARQWHKKWTDWLILTGKDYEDASSSKRENIRETFQLQTLNTLYNRLLLIRTFEDLGIIGQVISNGFIKFYDEKVELRDNKYIEPLSTASRQAEEVYSPLFRRDTPHDWYHYPLLITRQRQYYFHDIQNSVESVSYSADL